MIDDSDSEDFMLLSFLVDGPIGWVALVLALCVAAIALSNRRDCSKRTCAHGEPAVVQHECVCLEKARP